MTKKRWIGVAASAMVVLVIAAAAVLGCGGESGGISTGISERSAWKEGPAGHAGVDAQLEGSFSDEMRATEGVADIDAEMPWSSYYDPGSAPIPQIQLKVIKTAVVELEAGKGDYAKTRKDAVVITTAAGGYVEGESASRDDEGFTYATLTLRIPADKFDGVVEEVSALGEVVSTQVSTSDVSAEYVDLESRLRHLQAEEAFYLGLIGKAQTIQEMIAIREHLSAIQSEKERVQGRMNFLDQQVGYSTLTLAVEETAPEEDGEGFWGSVADAFKSFGRGLEKLAIGFFYALPYLVILVAVGVVVWLLVRRSRRRRPEETPGS